MKWISLPDIHTACSKKDGAYIITLPQRGSIARFLGVDSNCIVTIGSTKNLNERRKQFLVGLSSLEGHSAGNLFNIINTACRLGIQSTAFQFDYCEQETKEQALELESDLTAEYMIHFGEAPPFNSVIPKRKKAEYWKSKVIQLSAAATPRSTLQQWRIESDGHLKLGKQLWRFLIFAVIPV